jgi:hypothetical protein
VCPEVIRRLDLHPGQFLRARQTVAGSADPRTPATDGIIGAMPVRVVHSDGLVFVLQHSVVTPEEAHEIVRACTEINATGRAYMVVSEARGVAVPSAKVRQILGSSGSDEAAAKNQGRVSAVLLDNALMRGALISVSWFLTRTTLKPFETAKAALPYLEQHAKDQGIVITRADRARLTTLDELWSSGKPSIDLR